MVSAYTTIASVRSVSGNRPQREWREPIGTGDGTTVLFELSYAGITKNEFVVSRDQLGSVGADDVDVYLNNSTTRQSSSNYTLNAQEGTITFAAAPTNGHAVHCTYWHSIVSDDEITEAVTWAYDYITKETSCVYYTAGDTLPSQSDVFDGDGVSNSFKLTRAKVSALSSYSIDGTTSGLVANEDYYLYPEKQRIVFSTPPTSDYRNVQVTYTYGIPIDQTVKDLAAYLAALKTTVLVSGRTGSTGESEGPGKPKPYKTTNRPVTLSKMLKEMIEYSFKQLGVKVEVDGV